MKMFGTEKPGSDVGVSNIAFPRTMHTMHETAEIAHMHAPDVVAERERRARRKRIEAMRPTAQPLCSATIIEEDHCEY